MKTRFFTIVILALLCLSSCGEVEPGAHTMRLYIASDTHLLASELVPESNITYVKEALTGDGRVQEYDRELLEAFAARLQEDKPDFAMLTGDLTYNGEKRSHEEITEILSAVTDTKILVIPGNHDLCNQKVVGYKNDRPTATVTVTPEEFREIYRDYGYDGAYAYDEETLSYIYELSDTQWALMLDTTLCRFNDTLGENNIGGQLMQGTLDWLTEHLAYAKENGIKVISFTHHNLLVHNELFKNLYTLYNADAVLDLFSKYDVNLNFSGHLHIQSIRRDGGFYDIASGSLLDYGNRFGVLDIYENTYTYNAEKLPTDIPDFEQYAFDVFYTEYYKKQLARNEKIYDNAAAITDLQAKANTYYFDGDYEALHALIDANSDLVKQIKKQNSDSYFASILQADKTNQHSLTIEK